MGTFSLVEKDASNNLTPKVNSFWMAARFPDLVPKNIRKDASGSLSQSFQDYFAQFALSGSTQVTEAAIGESGSEQRIRPKELELQTVALNQNRDSMPKFLREVVIELERLQDVSVRLLTQGDSDGWTIPLATITTGELSASEKVYIRDQIAPLRLRRVCVFALRCANGDQFCLVVIEDTPIFNRLISGDVESPARLHQEITVLVSDYLSGDHLSEAMSWMHALGRCR
jgi:hypothetical protein